MPSDIVQSLAFAGIDAATRDALRETWPLIRDSVPLMLEEAYAPAAGRSDAAAPPDDQIAAARIAQARHWEALFRAEFDDAYGASLRQVGRTHARIGLDPRFLIAAHQTTLTRLHALVVQAHHADSLSSFGARRRLERAIRAVDQVVLFDLQLCLSAYIAEIRADAARAREDAWPVETGAHVQRSRADALFAASQRRHAAEPVAA